MQYEPFDVCACIGSFNATPGYIAFKIGPAFTAGNSVVFKVSEKSPLRVLFIASLFAEASFPPGAVNFVSGGLTTGAALAAHIDVRKISFTGSLNT